MQVKSQTSRGAIGRPRGISLRLQAVLVAGLLWAGLGWSGRGAEAEAQPVSVVRVLMLYTPQARDSAGGTTAILGKINAALVEANTVVQNSRVNLRFQLALTARLDYRESGSVSNDLARLRNPKDPTCRLAHQLRDQYAADLVCLVTKTGSDWDFYGLQGPSAANAFSIVREQYLTGHDYLPVALSFNFGCQLERAYADSVPAFPYGYGYAFEVDSMPYCTVEAFSGVRLPFFSNPDILFQDVPAGVPAGELGAADNARVLNQTAPLAAAFRGTAAKTRPPSVALTAPLDGARYPAGSNVRFTASATDTEGKIKRVEYYSAGRCLCSSASPPFTGFWRKAAPGEYAVVAVATDADGAVTVSDPVALKIVPVNDDFAGRIRLSGAGATARATNTLASLEAGEPEHDGRPGEHSLWWTWTAPAQGSVQFTLDADFEHALAVYTGPSLEALTPVASGGGWGEVTLRCKAARGETFQLALDSLADQAGPVKLTLRFSPAPTNDAFAQRALLRGNHLTVRSDNTSAGREPGELEHNKTPGCASLWWCWTAPANGTLALSLPEAPFAEPLWGIYAGKTLAGLVQCESAGAPGMVYVRKGVTYQIALDVPEVEQDRLGPFLMRLDFNPAPVNDDFARRTPIRGLQATLTGTTAYASGEPGAPSEEASIWWSWTAPASGWVTLRNLGSATVHIDVYRGSALEQLEPVGSGDDGCSFEAVAGTEYALSVWGAGAVKLDFSFSSVRLTSPAPGSSFPVGSEVPLSASTTASDGPVRWVAFYANGQLVAKPAQPPYSLVWSNPPADDYQLTAVATDARGRTHASPPVGIGIRPLNDAFAQAPVLTNVSLWLTNSLAGASVEPEEPADIIGWNTASLWWTWVAPASGWVTIELGALSGSNAAVDVYQGDSISRLTYVAGNLDSVTFAVLQGATYHLRVSAWPGTRDFWLHLSLSTLQLTSPASGQRFTQGANVALAVSSTAVDGDLRQVEYFANGLSLGVASAPPFSLVWSNAPAGQYTLIATSTDTQGATRNTPPVAVTVAPLNDDFARRQTVEGEQWTLNGTLAGASLEPGEPAFDDGYAHASVWYSWTAPATGRYALEINSGFYSLGLSVYTGNALAGLTPVTYAWYRLSFTAQAGVTYLIRAHAVESAYDASGAFTLHLNPVPGNDNFNERFPLTDLSGPIQANNFGATIEPGELGTLFPAERSLWWSWVAPASGRLTIQGAATSPYPLLHFYTGTSLEALAEVQRLNGSFYDGVSLAEFTVTAGTEYQIDADRLWNPDGSIVFRLTFNPFAANDNFTNRQVLAGAQVSVAGDNRYATQEPRQPTMPGAGMGRSVGYAWTAPASGLLTLRVSSAGALPTAAVFSGPTLTDLSPVAGTDSTGSTAFQVRLGQTYAIQIDGGGGLFTLDLILAPGPANDDFAQRIPLAGLRVTASGNDRGATFEPNEPPPGWGAQGSVWYAWTAPASGHVRVSCTNHMVYIYGGLGTNWTELRWVASGPDGETEFDAPAGNQYYIQVSSRWDRPAPNDYTVNLEVVKVLLVDPAPGTVLPGPADVTLSAYTIDLEEPVVAVEFLVGTNVLGMATNRPFTFIWTNVPVGRYWLRAVGIEASGATSVSSPVELRVAPPNDPFADRLQLAGTNVSFAGDNRAASAEPGEPGGPNARTLWWSWTAPANGHITITNGPVAAGEDLAAPSRQLTGINCNSKADSVIITLPPLPPEEEDFPLVEVYTGEALETLIWRTNNVTSDWWSGVHSLPAFTLAVRQGVNYQIVLGGGNILGAARMRLSFEPSTSPVNDGFAQSLPLTGAALEVAGTTRGATSELGEPASDNDFEMRTVWYAWTAPASGDARVRIQGNPAALAFGVYTGNALGDLLPVADGNGFSSWVPFFAVAGTTYQIQVRGVNGLEEDFRLGVEGPPPPPALDLVHTVRLPSGAYRVRVSGVPGQSFILQASANQRDWQTLCIDTLLGDSFDYLDAAAARFPQRYYRVLPLQASLAARQAFALLGPWLQPDGSRTLRLTGEPGQPFRVELSPNLVDWTAWTNGVLSEATLELTDPAPAAARFYRLGRSE